MERFSFFYSNETRRIQARERAAEIVKDDINYDPAKHFWNGRLEAITAILLYCFDDSPRNYYIILEMSPEEIISYLHNNPLVVAKFLSSFEEETEIVKLSIATSVGEIFERLLLFIEISETVN
jgi:hypothetical protein